MSQEHHYLFKFIIVGDTMVGKSCILLRLIDKRFIPIHDMTIGVEFGIFSMELEREGHPTLKIKLQVWDSAGQEQFRSITRSYYRGAVGALLVYDITRRESFEALDNWLKDLRNGDSNMGIMLVGNKSDLEYRRRVTYEEGAEYAKKNGLQFIETSAKDDKNITQAFEDVARDVVRRIEEGSIDLDSGNSGVRRGALLDTNQQGTDNNTMKQSSCC